jgi:hypothetical protein
MKRFSPAGVVLAVMALCYVSSAVFLGFNPSERAEGLFAGVTCVLLGLAFLGFCLPLGRLLTRTLKDVPFMPGPIPWPRTSPGWTVFPLVAALAFFALAAVAFYWGTDPATKPAIIRWLEGIFQ